MKTDRLLVSPAGVASAAALALTLPAVLRAQPATSSTVSPRHFDVAEANSSSGHPFGTGVLMRYLQIHDDLAGPARMFRGVAIRPDGLFPGTAVSDYTVTLSMWLSTAPRLSNNIRAVFEENHGADKTMVLDRRTISLPGRGLAGALPRGWAPPLLFDTVFPHTGLAGLTWEVETLGSTIGSLSLFHDAASGSDANPIPRNVFIGEGCRATGQGAAFTLNRTASFDWPSGRGTLTLTGAAAPANAPVFAVIGADTRVWNGVPLPLQIPGSASNPSGPCHVYSDVVGVLFTSAGATGSVAPLVLPIDLHTGLHGLTIAAQLWAVDAGAAFGMVTSRAAVTHFVAPFGFVEVSKLSQTQGGSPSITHLHGVVMRFDHD